LADKFKASHFLQQTQHKSVPPKIKKAENLQRRRPVIDKFDWGALLRAFSRHLDITSVMPNTARHYGRTERESAHGENRVPVQAARVHLPVLRDLRRHPTAFGTTGPLGAEMRRNIRDCWWKPYGAQIAMMLSVSNLPS
jgi:hypothetical protein